MSEFITAFVGALLVSNVLIIRGAGISPALVAHYTKRQFSILILSSVLTTLFASALLYVLSTYILVPMDLAVLNFLITVVVVILIAYLISLVLKLWFKNDRDDLLKIAALAGFNSAVIYQLVTALDSGSSALVTIAGAVGCSLGVSLFTMVISKLHERVLISDAPRRFKGISLTLVSIGLLMIALSGLNGII